MKKTISIIMAFVIALSTFAVMTFASDSTESIIGDKFTLATTSEKDTAAKFAIGEKVYGKVEGEQTNCYKLTVNEEAAITFTFKANSKVDVTVEKYDGTSKHSFVVDNELSQKITLAPANYYVTVKNNIPVVEESSTQEEASEEESSKAVDNDTGNFQPQSVNAEEASAEYSFVASTASLPTAYVKINHSTAELVSGDTLQLKLYDCTIENLNHFWRVYDDPATDADESKVATVTPDGLVKISMGSKGDFEKVTTVKVQAVMYYNNTTATKTCTITATPSNVFLEPYYGTSEDNCMQLGLGAYRVVKATTNVKNGKIIWTSSNPEIATVSSSGKITAVDFGEAIITATLEGSTTNRKILVNVADDYTSVMGITLDQHTAETRANEGFVLTYTFSTMPENDVTPSNSKVVFTSSNPEIATVDVDGNVTGVAEGTATITVTTEDGGYTDECKVTVTKAIPNWLMVIIAPFRIIYNLILLIIGK